MTCYRLPDGVLVRSSKWEEPHWEALGGTEITEEEYLSLMTPPPPEDPLKNIIDIFDAMSKAKNPDEMLQVLKTDIGKIKEVKP